MSEVIKRIRVPLALLALVLSLEALAALGILPSSDVLLSRLSRMLETWGLVVVVLFAFLENVVGFNVYFPGSVVLLAAMSLTAGNPLRAIQVWIAIVIPSIAAQQLNYVIGRVMRRSWNRSGAPTATRPSFKSEKSLWLLSISTYWHPHFAAITSIECGARAVPYIKFLKSMLAASASWYVAWGLIMYFAGALFASGGNWKILIIAYLSGWIVLEVVKELRERRRQTRAQSGVSDSRQKDQYRV